MVLKIVKGMNPDGFCAGYQYSGVDINERNYKGTAGNEEAIYIIQKVAGLI